MIAIKNIILFIFVLVLIKSAFSDKIDKKSDINYAYEPIDNALYLHVFNALIFSNKDMNCLASLNNFMAYLTTYKTNIIMNSA